MPRHSLKALFILIGLAVFSYRDLVFDLKEGHPYEREARYHASNSEVRRSSPTDDAAPFATAHPERVDPNLVIAGLPQVHHPVGRYLVLPNIGYISGYDSGLQDPVWVETRFSAEQSDRSAARPKSFSPDDRVDVANRIETRDYNRSGYDRGHMAPNEGVSLCFGRAAQIESFLLTNVVPQRPNLNRGIWETLEKIVLNDYAKRFGQVWIIDGPVFDTQPPERLHENQIAIPTRCYKIVIRQNDQGQIWTLAFEIPQELPGEQHDQDLLLQYLVSIQQIETDTGLTFLPALDETASHQIKDGAATRLW